MLLSVALPVPLYQNFDYLPLDNQQSLLPIGVRVCVPFGQRTLIGIVVGYSDPNTINIPLNKLKTINQVLDNKPIIDDNLLQLAEWLANYYHFPLGEVFNVMLPNFLYQGKILNNKIRYWKVIENAKIQELSKSATKQREQFLLIKNNLQNKKDNKISEEKLLALGGERPYLKKLADKGMIESFQENRQAPPQITLANKELTLNSEQQKSLEIVKNNLKKKKYQGFLLNGITGSGKTEIYLQAMHKVLTKNQQVLVLVPEISLTPQTKARFQQRFNANILLLHSGLNDSERLQGWQDCRLGHAQIIIGTRSTLLYPFQNLGLIIVDEAHDRSYKQQDSLRYHASDIALYRGFQLKIPVILGTATPSLEQLKLVEDKKLTEMKLTKRAGTAKPPLFQLIDARHTEKKGTYTLYSQHSNGQWQDTGLTAKVIQAIGETLEKGEQVLIFLNRRGFAPVLLCHACGWQADCSHCDAHLTVHKFQQKNDFLQCHHCGWRQFIPTQCPDCHSSNLNTLGMGTAQLTANLQTIFANPQKSKATYPIIQIDRDTTRNKNDWEQIYQQINNEKPSILVGTQMLAKGHHFPKVTLVVIPNVDMGFLSADFRSPEHTAQLIMQVAGRAGRGDTQGRVLIQTLQPQNPLLRSLVTKGYQFFAKQLLKERQMMGLPPCVYACLIRCEGKTLEKTQRVLQEIREILTEENQSFNNKIAISQVINAPMAKKSGRYHSQIFLLAQQRQPLHQILRHRWLQIKALPSAKYTRLSLDIDPINF